MRTLVIVIVAAASAPAWADRITVTVVDVAGGRAYVDAGRAAGIVPGATIAFGTRALLVVEVTETTAVVELGEAVLAIGASGTTEATPGAAAIVKKLPAPRPPDAFIGQWPEVRVPAASQTPVSVALGSGRTPGRAHVAVIGHAFGVADRTGREGEAEARAIASYDVLTDRPLAADLDVAARIYGGGADSGVHVPVFVRTAELRYGAAEDPRLAVGRLRYAASSLGMLDGARAAMHRGAFELAAFGGLVPDPISGKPETSASRFGGELIYDDATLPWQPRLSLTASGSTWDGKVDERRLAMTVMASRDRLALDGWAEAQQFPGSNPWGAHAVELTGAGATAHWRTRAYHVGADLTFLRPERSLRLAAALPAEWLCAKTPVPGDVADEACRGGDSWLTGSVTAGAQGARWSVDAVGAIARTKSITTAIDASGYLGGELRFGPRRLLASISAGQASFARWTAGQVGAGFVASRRVDLAIRYRPELLDYLASTKAMLLHALVIDTHYAVSAQTDLGAELVGTTGVDRDAIAVLTTLAWRPLP